MQQLSGLADLNLKINGQVQTFMADENLSLLRYLRDELGLVGTKDGCSTGHCGSCTVIVDGNTRRACLVKMRNLRGKLHVIETIEALNQESGLHPIQQSYLAAGAVQCGFCTPGMIMATKALLDRNPQPSERDIRYALRHNFCRCTGYQKIISAVQLAAQTFGSPDLLPQPEQNGGIRYSLWDIDGPAKVQGALPFADDRRMPGMLFGQVVWAEYPHALLRSVSIEQALQAPGVQAVLTAKDVPGLNGMSFPRPDHPAICGERVKFVGDVVALVLAGTPAEARAGAQLVRVDYEPLPVVDNWRKAAEKDAPLLSPQGNVCHHVAYTRGSWEEVAGAKDVVTVEGEFETPFVEHAYLEPEAGLAYPDEDGTIVIEFGTQQPFQIRQQVSKVLACPEEKIRVIATPLGGGFGGKAQHSIEALLALGVYHTGKPVKITLSRAESMRLSVKRHAFSLRYKLAADTSGKLLGLEAELFEDAGPYTGCSFMVLDQACIFAVGPYDVANVKVEGWAYFTNNAKGGAFRGFGINQVNFAMETLLDMLAEKLHLDPIELRLRNALESGKSTLSGEVLQHSVGVRATLEAVAQALQEELATGVNHDQPHKKIGIGVASGFKNVGAGKGNPDNGGAALELTPQGKVLLRASAVEMGQGIRTALAQIAAEACGISPACFTVVTGDTSLTPLHFAAVGERQTYITGNAIVHAAREFRSKLLDWVGQRYALPADLLELRGDTIYKRGEGTDHAVVTLASLGEQLRLSNATLSAYHYYVAPKTYPLGDAEARRTVPPEEYRNFPAYAYVTHAAIVEVDTETGVVRVRKMLAAHDVGVSINPRQIEGQIEGSCIMGLGYALKESYPLREGYPVINNFGQCHIPGIEEAPEIKSLIIEIPEPTGPFGAKGISEVATVPATAAILNAVYNACGVRTFALPLTRQNLLRSLKQ